MEAREEELRQCGSGEWRVSDKDTPSAPVMGADAAIGALAAFIRR